MYKPGQFVKVQNLKGLYRMKIVDLRNGKMPCECCAFNKKQCEKIIDCFKSVGQDGYLVKVK